MRCLFLLFGLVAGASSVFPESSASAERAGLSHPAIPETVLPPSITEDDVAGWVKRWQSRLGLKDWKIECRVVRSWQLQKGTIANINWSIPRKVATIKVLNPADSNLPKSKVLRDTELSVVHELVHLSMAKLPLDGNNTELEEEAVVRLSTALIDLDKPAN